MKIDSRTDPLEAALFYLSLGLSIIPIMDKKPLVAWKEFQSRLPKETELRYWWKKNPTAEPAMICGQVSQGVWVMDADCLSAIAWMKNNTPPTSLYATTKRGRHAFFKMPPDKEVRCKNEAVKGIKVDIKGEGGYVVLAPGTGKSWERFELCEDFLKDLTVWVPPASMQPSSKTFENSERGGFFTNDPVTFQPSNEGSRNHDLTREVGFLFHRGLTLEKVMPIALALGAQNNPPMKRAEIETTVLSIANAHQRNYGSPEPDAIEIKAEDVQLPQATILPPPNVLEPGGLLGEIMAYIEKSTVASFSLFALGAALTTLGTLSGQKVMTETGLRTNLYIFALAPSGTGKDAPLSAIPHLLLESACHEEYLGPSQLASSAALVSRLKSNPCQLLMIDEIGDLMGSVKNKNNVAKNELPKLLKELHSSVNRGLTKAYADSKFDVQIPWHHLSFYATGVPGDFWNALSSSDITGGFVARSLVFTMDLLASKKKKPNLKPPPELCQKLKIFGDQKPPWAGTFQGRPAPQMVLKTPAAEKFFEAWEEKYLKLQNEHRNDEDGRAALYNRAAEQAHKIALIHAVSLAGILPPPHVDLESVKFACDLVDWTLPQMIKEVTENINQGEWDVLRKRITKLAQKHKYLTRSMVMRNIRNHPIRNIEEALRILHDSGELIETEVITTSGKKSHCWKLGD